MRRVMDSRRGTPATEKRGPSSRGPPAAPMFSGVSSGSSLTGVPAGRRQNWQCPQGSARGSFTFTVRGLQRRGNELTKPCWAVTAAGNASWVRGSVLVDGYCQRAHASEEKFAHSEDTVRFERTADDPTDSMQRTTLAAARLPAIRSPGLWHSRKGWKLPVGLTKSARPHGCRVPSVPVVPIVLMYLRTAALLSQE